MPESQRLDKRQWIVLFIAGVALCFTFFALGLYVGRWSVGQPVAGVAAPAQPSLLPTASGVASQPTGQASTGTKEGGVAPSPAQENIPSDSSASPEGSSGSPGEEPGAAAEDQAGTGESSEASAGGSLAAQATEPPSSPTRHRLAASTLFFVRAGVFQDSDQAEELAATLRSRGFISAHTKRVRSEADVTSYLVLLGPWVDRESAARTRDELRREDVPDLTIVSQ